MLVAMIQRQGHGQGAEAAGYPVSEHVSITAFSDTLPKTKNRKYPHRENVQVSKATEFHTGTK
jgi:hypothetical protein